jgi:hypothetical protein
MVFGLDYGCNFVVETARYVQRTPCAFGSAFMLSSYLKSHRGDAIVRLQVNAMEPQSTPTDLRAYVYAPAIISSE